MKITEEMERICGSENFAQAIRDLKTSDKNPDDTVKSVKPTRLSAQAKELKQLITDFANENCKLMLEVPSLRGYDNGKDESSQDSPY